jgi:hypothetical protein
VQAAGIGNAGLRDRARLAHSHIITLSMLINPRALRIGMGPETHWYLRR